MVCKKYSLWFSEANLYPRDCGVPKRKILLFWQAEKAGNSRPPWEYLFLWRGWFFTLDYSFKTFLEWVKGFSTRRYTPHSKLLAFDWPTVDLAWIGGTLNPLGGTLNPLGLKSLTRKKLTNHFLSFPPRTLYTFQHLPCPFLVIFIFLLTQKEKKRFKNKVSRKRVMLSLRRSVRWSSTLSMQFKSLALSQPADKVLQGNELNFVEFFNNSG